MQIIKSNNFRITLSTLANHKSVDPRCIQDLQYMTPIADLQIHKHNRGCNLLHEDSNQTLQDTGNQSFEITHLKYFYHLHEMFLSIHSKIN